MLCTLTMTSTSPACSKVSVSGRLPPSFSGAVRPISMMCSAGFQDDAGLRCDFDRLERAHFHHPYTIEVLCCPAIFAPAVAGMIRCSLVSLGFVRVR